MPDTHAARRDRLRRLLQDRELDAALVTSLVNVRYLTGFTGSNAALIVAADGADLLGTDGRYAIQSESEVPDVDRLIERNTVPALTAMLARRRTNAVGYESHVVTVDGLEAMREGLPGARLVSLAEAVEELRAIKDPGEIELVRTACALADQALAELLSAGGIRVGRTEREIGLDLDFRMLSLGAEALSFETIVASGPHSAIPHHSPTDRTVQRGDFLTLDFGVTHEGYHSDMTRTYVVGEPADWQREVYRVVAEAQRAGREALAVGADVVAVDKAARDLIGSAGYADAFAHGLGHGVGLQIHEAPMMGPTGTGTLSGLMPVTVEPGVYLEGRGGVRIEDTLVVRADGPPDLLTMTPKDLTVLPAH
jgi:Xaa-Pro aminopeptidase